MRRPPLTPTVIVASAAELADEAGFGAVTLSQVARRLGVQAPSLYSHVRDLAALRDGVMALALDELADRIAVAVAGRSRGLALRGFADAHRDYAAQSPGRWQSLQHRAGVGAVDSGAAARLVALTDAVFLGYGLSSDDRVHATRLVGGAVNGFIALESIGSFDHRAPAPESSWVVAIDSLDAVLSAWPTSPATKD